MINRVLHQNILEDWDKKKAIVLLGPRQVGKTTLIQHLVEEKKVLFLKVISKVGVEEFSK